MQPGDRAEGGSLFCCVHGAPVRVQSEPFVMQGGELVDHRPPCIYAS